MLHTPSMTQSKAAVLPILIVACRDMTSGESGVSLLGSSFDKSCSEDKRFSALFDSYTEECQ